MNQYIQRTTALLFLVLGLTWSTADAQQDPMFTQYFTNQLPINPAYAGSRDGLSMLAFIRHQWTGFEGAPRTQTISAHGPLGESNSNLGVTLLHDKLGITERYSLNGAYAYRIDFGPARLAFGLHGQVRLRQMRWDQSNPLDEIDGAVTFSQRQLILPNFGAGLYLDGDHFFFSAAMPHMLENELPFAQSSNTQNLSQLRRHVFVSGGLVIGLTEDVKLRPMALWKQVANAPSELDLNLGVLVKDRLLVGGTYRTRASADGFIQFQLDEQWRLGYAYDFSLTRLRQVNSGSHELFIGFDIGRKNKGFDNPRYF